MNWLPVDIGIPHFVNRANTVMYININSEAILNVCNINKCLLSSSYDTNLIR